MLGTQELLLILGAGILLFGAKRIPEIARGLGRSVHEFKKGLREEPAEGDKERKVDQEDRKEPQP
ncbi:MAG TPA: twin-arginine translocase TatA/TatE family subunit [candidate division Zixibacteria bacterium]|jgi:sec-independent protein translocase protein TatA